MAEMEGFEVQVTSLSHTHTLSLFPGDSFPEAGAKGEEG
jgi:hypothetical protein